MDRAGPLFVQEVKEEHANERVEVWFEDESRFGQQGSLTWLWARKGSCPRAVRQTEYQAVYLFGAANPLTGEATAIVLPRADAQMMELFLAHLSAQLSEDTHVVLVLDNAGWHVATDLTVPENITLLPLPPYAPELNPMERLWLWLKIHHLCNRVYLHYNALLDAACDAWNTLTPERIKSICATDWILGQN